MGKKKKDKKKNKDKDKDKEAKEGDGAKKDEAAGGEAGKEEKKEDGEAPPTGDPAAGGEKKAEDDKASDGASSGPPVTKHKHGHKSEGKGEATKFSQRVPPLHNYTLDLTCLTPAEEKVLRAVIERDDAELKPTHDMVRHLKQELDHLRYKGVKQKGAAPKPKCLRCRCTFGIWRKLFPFVDQGYRCMRCQFRTCRQCRYKQANGKYMCALCVRYREIKWLTGEWMGQPATRLHSSDLIRVSLRDKEKYQALHASREKKKNDLLNKLNALHSKRKSNNSALDSFSLWTSAKTDDTKKSKKKDKKKKDKKGKKDKKDKKEKKEKKKKKKKEKSNNAVDTNASFLSSVITSGAEEESFSSGYESSVFSEDSDEQNSRSSSDEDCKRELTKQRKDNSGKTKGKKKLLENNKKDDENNEDNDDDDEYDTSAEDKGEEEYEDADYDENDYNYYDNEEEEYYDGDGEYYDDYDGGYYYDDEDNYYYDGEEGYGNHYYYEQEEEYDDDDYYYNDKRYEERKENKACPGENKAEKHYRPNNETRSRWPKEHDTNTKVKRDTDTKNREHLINDTPRDLFYLENTEKQQCHKTRRTRNSTYEPVEETNQKHKHDLLGYHSRAKTLPLQEFGTKDTELTKSNTNRTKIRWFNARRSTDGDSKSLEQGHRKEAPETGRGEHSSCVDTACTKHAQKEKSKDSNVKVTKDASVNHELHNVKTSSLTAKNRENKYPPKDQRLYQSSNFSIKTSSSNAHGLKLSVPYGRTAKEPEEGELSIAANKTICEKNQADKKSSGLMLKDRHGFQLVSSERHKSGEKRPLKHESLSMKSNTSLERKKIEKLRASVTDQPSNNSRAKSCAGCRVERQNMPPSYQELYGLAEINMTKGNYFLSRAKHATAAFSTRPNSFCLAQHDSACLNKNTKSICGSTTESYSCIIQCKDGRFGDMAEKYPKKSKSGKTGKKTSSSKKTSHRGSLKKAFLNVLTTTGLRPAQRADRKT